MNRQRIATDMIEQQFIAEEKFPAFNSFHEGLAVIWEEFEELKAEVFKNRERRDFVVMRSEAIDLGAAAMRFVYDLLTEVEK